MHLLSRWESLCRERSTTDENPPAGCSPHPGWPHSAPGQNALYITYFYFVCIPSLYPYRWPEGLHTIKSMEITIHLIPSWNFFDWCRGKQGHKYPRVCTSSKSTPKTLSALLWVAGWVVSHSLHYKADLFEYIHCGGCLLSIGLSLGHHLLSSSVKGCHWELFYLRF